MKRYIVVRTQFEAIHFWPECPIPEVSFLKHPHRHIFHVEMKLEVGHNDRDIEFIQFKRILENYIEEAYKGQHLGRTSCEDIAEDLLKMYPIAVMASVFEDNENGAEVWREKE